MSESKRIDQLEKRIAQLEREVTIKIDPSKFADIVSQIERDKQLKGRMI